LVAAWCTLLVTRSVSPVASGSSSGGPAVSRVPRCGEKLLLSDRDVIGRNVDFRCERAEFLPFFQCRSGFWVLFKEPSGSAMRHSSSFDLRDQRITPSEAPTGFGRGHSSVRRT
jgi:hypothetical protein